MELTPREKWVAITAIMKTSQGSKNLTKDQRDQLFLYLHRNHAHQLDNPEIQQIERDVVEMGKSIQAGMIDEALKVMGTQDKEKIFKETEKLIGKDDTDKIIQELQKKDDDKLV